MTISDGESVTLDDAQLDQLSHQWDDRGRRAAAAAWVHHLGEVLFVLSDRWKDQPDAVPYLLALACRDTALIVANSRGIGTERLWKAVALITDLFVAERLSKKIRVEDFVQDHAISQWGLSAAWATEVNDSEARLASSLAFPLAVQITLAKIWGVSWRDIPWYVTKEGFWSAATLWAVDDLRRQISAAVRQGHDSAKRQAEALRESRKAAARADTSEVVWRWIHRDGISALGTIAFEAEARSRSKGVPPERASHLQRVAVTARREANLLRTLAPIDEFSLAARLGRVLAIRDLNDRPYDWASQPLPPRVRINEQYLGQMIILESILINSHGQLALGIDSTEGRITLWARGEFNDHPLPASFSLTGHGHTQSLQGEIPCVK